MVALVLVPVVVRLLVVLADTVVEIPDTVELRLVVLSPKVHVISNHCS